MDEPFKVGLYYIPLTKTLVIGVPKDNLYTLRFPTAVLTFNLGDMLAFANENRIEVQYIQLTNLENYDLIADKQDKDKRLWMEFIEFKKQINAAKKDAKILKIKKDEPQ